MPSKAMTTGGSWATLSKTYKKALDTMMKKINGSFANQTN
jgi:hypothetical protein